jgi:gliding motility-associated lipoprotein GldD
MKIKYISIILFCIVAFVGCSDNQNSTPKPKTYFRIDVPKPNYLTFDTLSLPFTFQYPNYGVVEEKEDKNSNINWFNIYFKDYGCKLYMTFINLNKNVRLDTLINDSYNFTKEHDKFSSGVIEKEFANNKDKVYGYLFDIKGSQVASPYQFYVTDSSKYFLRGALYFDYKANNDSLSPIINRIKTDIDYMISTLKWK